MINDDDEYYKGIYTHPSNFNLLTQEFSHSSYSKSIFDIPVYTNSSLPKTQPIGKVKFPTDGNWKFCEFEEKDEEWALTLGIAKRERMPAFYRFKMPKLDFDFMVIDEYKDITDKYANEIINKILKDEEKMYATYYSKL